MWSIHNPLHCRYMFWTDWGQDAKIERATLSGDGRTSIVTSDVVHPNGIVIDFSSNKLFWVDSVQDYIATADYNGKNRKEIFQTVQPLHPFDLCLLSSTLYWTERNHVDGLLKINKTTGRIFGYYKTLTEGKHLRGIAVYDSSVQPAGMTIVVSVTSA